jgi:hypothetical protein
MLENMVLNTPLSVIIELVKMDDHNELFAGEIAQFRQYSRLIDGLYTRNSAGNKQELERIIDQLNNIEYVPKLFPEQVKFCLFLADCAMLRMF